MKTGLHHKLFAGAGRGTSVIVLDASAMVDALVGAEPPDELFHLLTDDIHVPHLIDVEVASVLPGLELGRVLLATRTAQARDDYWDFALVRHEMEPLADRVWHLRHRFTSDDATYIALAEALDAPLVTCDRTLATNGHRAQVRVVSSTRSR